MAEGRGLSYRRAMFSHEDMIASLSVEMIDELLYRGAPLQMGLPRIYGGQILGQSLAAAMLTVEDDGEVPRRPHSFHAYFLRPGDTSRDVIFDVDPIRDGRSFTTRRVVAKQKGRAIFNASMSFQKLESGVSHQIDLPGHVPLPEDLPRESVAEGQQLVAMGMDTEQIRRILLTFGDDVLDIRTPYPGLRLAAAASPQTEYGYWFRFKQAIPDDPVIHRALLAFISDRSLMLTAMIANGVTFLTHEVMGASLDHAMWFHDEIRLDQWLYYHIDSPRSARARGLNRGSFYTRDGVLIASTAQEGLMRVGAERERDEVAGGPVVRKTR